MNDEELIQCLRGVCESGAGDQLHRQAADALEAHADCDLLGITEPKSAVRWEYGVQRDNTKPMTSRKAAEEAIKRQRTRKGYGRITGQRLVRRRVSEWEEVTDG